MSLEFFNSISPEILDKVQNMQLKCPTDDCYKEVDSVLQKTIFVGGKRLRPLLTYLMGDLFSIDLDKITPYARSIEMAHGASLCHDDVIDSSEKRRGNSTLNILEGNKKAILAGDYLFASVIEHLTKIGPNSIVKEVSGVFKSLALGEWLQYDVSKYREKYCLKLIEDIAYHKTASVMKWCCVVPPLLTNMDENIVFACREFGQHLGMAFQMIDDTLDFEDTSLKDTNIDIKNGILNIVVFKWLEKHPSIFKSYCAGEDISYLINKEILHDSILEVKKIASDKLKYCRSVLHKLFDQLPLNTDQKVKDAKSRLEGLTFMISDRSV